MRRILAHCRAGCVGCFGEGHFDKRKPGTRVSTGARFVEDLTLGLTTAVFAASAAATATTVSSAATAAATVITTTAAAAATEFTTGTAAATESTAAASRTVFAGTRFVDCQRTAVKFLAVELIDRCLSRLVRVHRDEGESARAACEFVLHQHDFGNRAALREQVLNCDFGRIERQIADIEFVTHDITFL